MINLIVKNVLARKTNFEEHIGFTGGLSWLDANWEVVGLAGWKKPSTSREQAGQETTREVRCGLGSKRKCRLKGSVNTSLNIMWYKVMKPLFLTHTLWKPLSSTPTSYSSFSASICFSVAINVVRPSTPPPNPPLVENSPFICFICWRFPPSLLFPFGFLLTWISRVSRPPTSNVNAPSENAQNIPRILSLILPSFLCGK